MNTFGKDQGFTLVELMVVVLIIGILVAIAVPIYSAAKGSAQQKTCWANQRTIDGAAQTYQASNGALPPVVASGGTAGNTSALVTGGYVKVWPYCLTVAGSGATSTAAYGLDASGFCTLPTGDTHSSYNH